MIRSLGKKGIVLITTLLTICILLMLASGTMVSLMRQNAVASSYYKIKGARQAAQTGIDYAKTRLHSDPTWGGTGTAVNEQVINYSDSVAIQEHVYTIDGQKSIICVEGKIKMGDQTGYFDMYFISPGKVPNNMKFFDNSDKTNPGGARPSWIPLCTNLYTNSSTTTTLDSNGNTYRNSLPAGSVLLACRGKVGDEIQVVETCLRIKAKDPFDTVAAARDGMNYNLTDGGQLYMGYGSLAKPSVARCGGNVIFNVNSANTNFLALDTDDEISANGEITSSPITIPSTASTYLKASETTDQMSMVPQLKFDDIKPDTSDFSSIPAGTYKIERPAATSPYPKVTFYSTGDPNADLSTMTGTSTTAIKDLIDSGIMVYARTTNKLVLLYPLKVTDSEDYSLKSLVVTSGTERVTIKIANEDTSEKSVATERNFLINETDGGGIFVKGEISGDGVVMAKGDIEIEAESQLSTPESTGMGLYSEGNITIKPMSKVPITDGTINTSITYCKNTDNLLTAAETDITSKMISSTTVVEVMEDTYGSPTWQLLKNLGMVKRNTSGAEVCLVNQNTLSYLKNAHENYNVQFQFSSKLDEKDQIIGARDGVFRGLMYACKGINVETPYNSFRIEGGFVANGKIPDGTTYSGMGTSNISANGINLIYDTNYLSMALLMGQCEFETIYWGSFKD